MYCVNMNIFLSIEFKDQRNKAVEARSWNTPLQRNWRLVAQFCWGSVSMKGEINCFNFLPYIGFVSMSEYIFSVAHFCMRIDLFSIADFMCSTRTVMYLDRLTFPCPCCAMCIADELSWCTVIVLFCNPKILYNPFICSSVNKPSLNAISSQSVLWCPNNFCLLDCIYNAPLFPIRTMMPVCPFPSWWMAKEASMKASISRLVGWIRSL